MSEIEYIEPQQETYLYDDVCHIIDGARGRIATFVNTEACLTNWYVGKRIKDDVLYNKRAEYGKQVLKHLSLKLTERYGSGWGYEKLKHCVRSAYLFSEEEIRYATRTQLNWTHLRSLMGIKDPLERQFYAQMCSIEHWDTRTLDDSEKDLENAILSQVEEFLSELGSDFTFVKRQKRITVDAVDYYIDLLFFHRELRRLVAIDLKLGKFKPEHEGQMRLYLRYLNQNDRKPWEESPIGLILCSEGNTEHIEYLMLDEESPIKVAQYYTKLPDKKLLSDKLRKAIAIAREHYSETSHSKDDNDNNSEQ